MCFQSFFATRLNDSRFRLFPIFIATDVFGAVVLVPQRDLRFELRKIQCVEDDKDNIHHLHKFLLNLIRCTENVCIVLRKASYTRKSVQFTALLVAIHRSEFGKPNRQISVGVRFYLIYFAVVGAVHWFEHKLFPFLRRLDGTERIGTILFIVTARFVQIDVADVGRHNLFVAKASLYLFEVILQFEP